MFAIIFCVSCRQTDKVLPGLHITASKIEEIPLLSPLNISDTTDAMQRNAMIAQRIS